MAALTHLSVLLVDADPDTCELVGSFLEGEGAEVRTAGSAAEARASLASHPADVVLTEIGLPREDGFAFVTALRADPATKDIPVIAVTGYADARTRERVLGGGFQKLVTKPFDVFALPAAIASVARTPRQAPAGALQEAWLTSLIAERDMRTLLETINHATTYRYTSILRFDDERLESVWTFDRRAPLADSFPDTPVSASYCAYVRSGGGPFTVENAEEDERLRDHPKRKALRAYCGVPIHRLDGSVFGTLCHYDEAPHAIQPETLAAMARVAELLRPVLPEDAAAQPLRER